MNPPISSSSAEKLAADEAQEKLTFRPSHQDRLGPQDRLSALYDTRIPVSEEPEFRESLPIMAPRAVADEQFSRWPTVIGAALSVLWAGICMIAVMGKIGALNMGAMLPHEWGVLLTGAFAPVALIWYVVGQIRRTSDTRLYGEILRAELQSIILPSEDRQHRISSDIERLCQQASHLSASSKAVLKSIHRARAGLQTEMRDFVGLSRKTEFHLDRLADSLNAKSAQVLALTDTLEERVAEIESRTGLGAQAWETAARSVAERMTGIESIFDRGSDRILSAAEQAKARAGEIETHLNATYSGLRGGVDEVALKLADLSTTFDQHNDTLARATDRVVSEAARLGSTIETQIDHLDEISQTAMESMGKSSTLLSEQKNMLEQGATILTSHADRVVERIQDSLRHLNQSAELVDSRAAEMEVRLSKQANSIGSVITGFTEQSTQIEQAGLVAANRLSEALSLALSGADSITSAVRRSVELMEKAGQEAESQAGRLAAAATDESTALIDAGETIESKMREVVGLLATARTQTADMLALSDVQIQAVRQAVSENGTQVHSLVLQLQGKAEEAQSRLHFPVQQLQNVIRDLSDRHAQIEDTLKKRVDDLADVSLRAKDQAENIRVQLRNQVMEISTLSGQISAHTKTLGEQLFTQKSQLIETSQDVLQRVETTQNALDRQVQTLQSTSRMVADDLDGLGGKISDRCAEVRTATQSVLSDIGQIDAQLEAKSGRLVEQSGALKTALDETLTAIEKSVTRAEPVYLKALDQAGQLQGKLETLTAEYAESGASNLQRLQEIGIVFDQRLNDLRTGSADALQLLRTSTDHLRDRVEDIGDASSKALEKLQFHEQALENQRSNILLSADQTLLKMQAIQKTVESQFADLSTAIGSAVAQIEDATKGFGASARSIEDATNTARAGLMESSALVVDETTKLQVKAVDTADQAQALATSVKGQAETLVQSASVTLLNLKTLGDSFMIRARELEEHMKASLATAHNYGSELKSQAARVGDASSETADKIARAVMQLSGKVAEADRLSNDVLARVQQARADLDTQTEKFIGASQKAVQSAEDASGHYSRQSTALFKAAQDAAVQAERIREAHMRTQRDAFLTSAKFVLETLHSLSVDFTRQLDPDPSDRLWRAYQRGDVGAFTRRLIAVDEVVNIDKIRDKFADDHEFRTYVQRYIRAFEELFDQALANDHGDLLAATFLSSDIGRLYYMLCQASGKTPKSGRAERSAA